MNAKFQQPLLICLAVMFAIVIVICIIFGLNNVNSNVCGRNWCYPDVKRDQEFSYKRFGIDIPDPYHWLEDSKSEQTKHFVEEQNKVTYGYIKSNPNYDSIRSNFHKLFNYTNYGIPHKHGNKYFMSKRDAQQNQGVIYMLDSLDDDQPRVFIDPNTFSTDGTISLTFYEFSPDGKWCAYGTSKGGSDWIKIKIKNVETGLDLQEELRKIKFAGVGWNKNNKGFFYSYYDNYNGTGDGTETEIPKYQKLYYHRLNTDQDQDWMIHEFPQHPKWLVGTPVISEDGRQLHLFPTEGTSNNPWLYARFDPDFDQTFKWEFKWIVEKPDGQHYHIGDDDKCNYIITNHKAKNFRLVCVDLENPSRDNWKDIVPTNSKDVLSDAFIVNKDHLVCLFIVDVVNKIRIFNITTGEHLYDVDTMIGTISLSSSRGKSKETKEFFYKFTSYLSPGIIYHYDFNILNLDERSKVYKQSAIDGLNKDDYIVKQIKYESKDGTKIPMFVVSGKNIEKNGHNPTWLNAYGGFSIAIQPGYNPLAMFFVQHLNGIFAVANIRGGGEYGDDWHQQGMMLNKQNVFDDFASAGEWLTKENYTSREYLTINGRSNGGLLIGASCNQRPEIFGSAIAEVGVMDMLKFPLFTIGYAWMEEYGDPVHNETDFHYIRKYSPLHNINDNLKQYPNMLVLTADHDDRVVPAHSYKFISELQYKLGKQLPDTPMMIRIDVNSGHGAGTPISKWIEQYTDIICFLLNSTPYEYCP